MNDSDKKYFIEWSMAKCNLSDTFNRKKSLLIAMGRIQKRSIVTFDFDFDKIKKAISSIAMLRYDKFNAENIKACIENESVQPTIFAFT